jgi:hypothetical protein
MKRLKAARHPSTFCTPLRSRIGPILLTQNLHLTPITQQAEKAGFTREEVTRRASQFSLKINKKDKVVKFQSLELAGWYQTVPYLRLGSQMR